MQPKVATIRNRSSSSSLPFTPASRPGGAFDLELIDERPGLIIFRATGLAVDDVFKDEAGGHRWQRQPPNDKRGRIHTSTVTVAVLREPDHSQLAPLRECDLEITTCRGSGPGGQARNKTESAVQVKHLPTKLFVRSDSERSQSQNKATAIALLRAKLWAGESAARREGEAAARKQQVGSGMRGDKRRTIRVQDGQVHDHITGRRWDFKNYVKGIW